MNRTLKLAAGSVLVLAGVVWTLQGLDLLGGSGMSGHTFWAVVGPIVALAGAWLVVSGLRTTSTRRDL